MDLVPKVAMPLVGMDPKREGYSCTDWGDSFRSGVKNIPSE